MNEEILYRLKHGAKLFQGVYGGVIIPKGTLVKILYSDASVTHCEAIDGPCDGLSFIASIDALTYV